MKATLTLAFVLSLATIFWSTPARADKVGEGKVPFMVEKGTGKKFYVRPVVHRMRAQQLASSPKVHVNR
jgi:hypothetical protein